MKIAVIQASSQKDKNSLLYDSLVEIAMLISILLGSKAVDFVVTGCSSGQGMMLACNSLPSVLCGYIEKPSDAYLFGRINNGNAISIPLGLNFGWASEINVQCVLEKLFDGPFGIGYPKQDSIRKQRDTNLLKSINSITKRKLKEVLPKMDIDFIKKIVSRDIVFEYVMKYGQDNEIMALLQSYR